MKRFFHISGILIGGIIIALVILGLFVDTNSYTTTLYVEAPVDESWATFTDGDRQGEWMLDLTSSELISGAEHAVGSHYRLHFGDGTTVDERITAIVPHQRYSFDMETSLFTGSVDVTFAPQDNGTRIAQVTTVEGSAFHWRALLPVIKPIMQNEQMKVLDALGRLIENDPTLVPAP